MKYDCLCPVAMVLAAIGLTACQTTTTPLTWSVPPGASTLEINGYPLAYSARGSGPTVVFVPGVLTDYRIWGGALAQWESSYRIVAVSPRHFFPEKWQGNGRGLHGALGAKDLDAFIEKQGGPVSSFAPAGARCITNCQANEKCNQSGCNSRNGSYRVGVKHTSMNKRHAEKANRRV